MPKPKIVPVRLNVEQQEKFKDQILLVLADYQNCNRKLNDQGLRLEVAGRIMDNLRVVAALKL